MYGFVVVVVFFLLHLWGYTWNKYAKDFKTEKEKNAFANRLFQKFSFWSKAHLPSIVRAAKVGNPTAVAAVPREGAPGPWSRTRLLSGITFVSLPFKDNHDTSPSQSTEPLSLVGICLFFLFVCFFNFRPCHAVCRILVPQPGIELGPTAVKVLSPNHWTAREFPSLVCLFVF